MLVKVFRFEVGKDAAPYFAEYEIPGVDEEWTVMDVMDYISENLDPTVSYYKHSACDHGICDRCLLQVNGKPGLACTTRVDPAGVLTLEPAARRTVVKDLVTVN